MIDSYNKFNELSEGKTKSASIVSPSTPSSVKEKDADSIKNILTDRLKSSFIPLDSTQRKQIIDNIDIKANDSIISGPGGNRISFGNTRLTTFIQFQKTHPNMPIDEALDSLGYNKNFTNRFFYNRGKVVNSFMKDAESRNKFMQEMISYASISLFILLPIFTLSLKFFYIRRRFTYVEHLIFVFHTQTVFFLLLTLFFLINFMVKDVQSWIFIVLFLIYLLIAMRKFYRQNYFKTFVKFLLINMVYMFLASIGVFFVAIISFAFF